MAYRSFRDANGVEWEAWDVIPRLVERRMADRRQGGTADESERRRGVERRAMARRRASLAGLEQGWLCFERGEEKRRLTPIPPDWPRCDDTRLAEYCNQAGAVRRPLPQAVLRLADLAPPAERVEVARMSDLLLDMPAASERSLDV